jgi:predicted nucleic acid-binding protein
VFLMAPFVVVYDASVMYPVRVVDLLIRLAQKGFVEAKWTDDIHEEWIRSLLKDRSDLTREQLERRRAAMDSAVRDSVVTDYEPLIESVEGLPDPDDRHVVAAAIRAKAQTIVTNNISDFPEEVLQAWDIEAQTADEFVLGLVAINRDLVIETLIEQRTDLRTRPLSPRAFLNALAEAGLVETVRELSSDFLSRLEEDSAS